MAQHQGKTGPTTVNDAAPVTSSMYAGSQPSSGFKGRAEWHRGWTSREPDIPIVSNESLVCSRPDSPRVIVLRHHAAWQVAPPDVTVFALESTTGWQPPLPRAAKAQRGPSFFPWAGTPAPFSPEMTAGSLPPSNRVIAPKKLGWFQVPQVDQFSVEMTLGWHPDRARFFSGPRPVGWSVSQTTPVAAPFSVDMHVGNVPLRGRFFRAREPHLPNVVQIDTFDLTTTYGWHPASPRLCSTRTVIGWTVSQTTHTPAPLSQEMLEATRPSRPRLPRLLRSELPWLGTVKVIFSALWAATVNKIIGPDTDSE